MKTTFKFLMCALFILSVLLIAKPVFAIDDEQPPAPTPSSDATLSSLSTPLGTLSPSFSAQTSSYTVVLAPGVPAPTTVSATTNEAHATTVITSGGTTVTVLVTAQDGVTTKTYAVIFIQIPLPEIPPPPTPPITHNYSVTVLGDNPMNLVVGATFTDPGATLSDNGTVISTEYRTKDTVDTNTAGTYTINYYFSDFRESGVRTVVVNNAPVVHNSQSTGGSAIIGIARNVIPPTPVPTAIIPIETPIAKLPVIEKPVVENTIPRNTTEVAIIPNNTTDSGNKGNENQTASIGNADTGSSAAGPITKTAGAVAGTGVVGYGAYLALAWKQKLAFEKFFGFRANPDNQEVVKNVKKVFEKLQETLKGAQKSGDQDAIKQAKEELEKAIKIAQNHGHN